MNSIACITSADDSARLSLLIIHLRADKAIAEESRTILNGNCGDHAIAVEGVQVQILTSLELSVTISIQDIEMYRSTYT